MPLNILQHKTWNVWNRDTLQKIDRDEREHKEHVTKERKQEADNVSAARLDILRNRALQRERGDLEGAREPRDITAGPFLSCVCPIFVLILSSSTER
jgi:hypothetical protein